MLWQGRMPLASGDRPVRHCGVTAGHSNTPYPTNGIRSVPRHSLIFARGGRGGDEGLARMRGRYLRKTWRNCGKNEVRLGAWHHDYGTTIRREDRECIAVGDADDAAGE